MLALVVLQQTDARKLEMRTPGIEPGAQAWEACMLPLHYERLRLQRE